MGHVETSLRCSPSDAVGFLSDMVIFMTQQWLPMNPQGLPNLSWHTGVHAVTGVSSATRTGSPTRAKRR